MKTLYFLASFRGLFTVVSNCCSNASPSFPSQFSSSLQGVNQLAGEVSSSRMCCVSVLATSHTDTCRINKALPVCLYFGNRVFKLDLGGTSCICLMAPALILCFELSWHCCSSGAVILVLEHSCGAMLDTGSLRCWMPSRSSTGLAAQPCPQDWDWGNIKHPKWYCLHSGKEIPT